MFISIKLNYLKHYYFKDDHKKIFYYDQEKL